MGYRLRRGDRTEVHIELADDYSECLELNHRFTVDGKTAFLNRVEMLWDWFHDQPIEGLKLEEKEPTIREEDGSEEDVVGGEDDIEEDDGGIEPE